MESQEKRVPHPKLMARHREALAAFNWMSAELGRLGNWTPESSRSFETLERFLNDVTQELASRRDQLAAVTEAYAGGLLPELAAELEHELKRDTERPGAEYSIQVFDRSGEPLAGASVPVENDDAANDEARELALEHNAAQARVHCKTDGRTWFLEVSP